MILRSRDTSCSVPRKTLRGPHRHPPRRTTRRAIPGMFTQLPPPLHPQRFTLPLALPHTRWKTGYLLLRCTPEELVSQSQLLPSSTINLVNNQKNSNNNKKNRSCNSMSFTTRVRTFKTFYVFLLVSRTATKMVDIFRPMTAKLHQIRRWSACYRS